MSTHLPLRTCSGCGGVFAKRDLLRIARSSQGDLSLDLVGKKPGRGFYLCRRQPCLEHALKNRNFEKKIGARLPEELLMQLRESIKNGQEVEPCRRNESMN